MPFLIADVMDTGKNIEAVHQKYILEINQHKNKIELLWSWEISFVSKDIYETVSTEMEKKMKSHCHHITILLKRQSYNEI